MKNRLQKKATVAEVSANLKSYLDKLGNLLVRPSEEFPNLDAELQLKTKAMEVCYEACIRAAKSL